MSAKSKAEDPVLQDAPTVTLQCLWAQCTEYQVTKTVPAGVVVAANVLACYAKHACMVCGMDMALVHE